MLADGAATMDQVLDLPCFVSALFGGLVAWAAARRASRTAARELATEAVRLRRLIDLLGMALEQTGSVEVQREADGGLIIRLEPGAPDGHRLVGD